MIESIHSDDFKIGDVYDIETDNNRHYTLERQRKGFFIAGHPSYCAIMTRCIIVGATPGGWVHTVPGLIKVGEYFTFEVGQGPDLSMITTSKIKSITPAH